MSRTLVLMRHASPEGWSSDGDKGRSLTVHGRREAAQAGLELKPLGISHVLCSSAARNRETFDCLGLDVHVEFMDALYDCSTETMVQRIGEVPDEVGALLVIGHAPAIPSLTADLTWVTSHKEADDIQCWFPTAAYSRFTLDGSWASIAEDTTVRLDEMRRIGY